MPLFHVFNKNGFYFSSELKGLPFDGLGEQVTPRTIFLYEINNKGDIRNDFEDYYNIGQNKILGDDDDNDSFIYEKVRNSLISSVKDRLQSERDIGALLSGGLDSSLVCAIASRILKNQGRKLKTFSNSN